MTLPVQAVISDPNQQRQLMDVLTARLRSAKQFWRPLNLRQDYWANMYLLLDVLQQSKPLGVARRYTSNEPRTGFDAAQSILTRNPVGWRIPLLNSEDENAEERRKFGKVERTLEALIYDVDELASQRLLMPFWKQVTFQGLLRGMIWGKVQVSAEALQYRTSPIIAKVYDSRLVYPHVDDWGLNHVLIEELTNLGNLVTSYPGVFQDFADRPHFDVNTPCLVVEFWSNDRGERKGINAVLAQIGTPVSAGAWTPLVGGSNPLSGDSRWIIPPFFHGYTPDELPVVGVAVNGARIDFKPAISSPLEQRLQERADLLAMESMNWHGPGSWTAEVGRGLLSSVEDQVPQYNELIATIFQHFSIGTYGTWVFKTPTGELPDFEPGIESKVALRPEESVQRIVPEPISPDAYRLIQILQDERQKGILSNILQAVTPFSGTGVLFQQVTNSALNALEPYFSGNQQFGIRVGTSLLAQLQKVGPMLKPFQIDAMSPKKSFFRIEFDPRKDLDKNRHYRPIPVMKPALPDDLTVRLTAARMALDPRLPMLSLVTVLEEILQRDDPPAEVDRIWEDMAQRDPVMMPEIMAQAFDRLDEPELAARMREVEFQAAMMEELKVRQLTGSLGMQGPGFALPGPENGPLAASTARTGTEQNQPFGAEALGAAGERVTV